MATESVALREAPAPALRAAAATEPPRVDLGPLIQAITRELRAAVPAARIEALLRHLLEHEFRDARVAAFVPILLQRAACDTLRRELPPHNGSTDA